MKKGSFILLLVTAAFLCVLTGVLIGRHTSGNYYHVTEQINQSSASEESTVFSSGLGALDINTASASELEALPGIGGTLAQRIIAYRDENGPFSSVDDLKLVEGIGDKRIDTIRDYITVGG